MELADMQDLGSCGQPCGFESHIPQEGDSRRPGFAAVFLVSQ